MSAHTANIFFLEQLFNSECVAQTNNQEAGLDGPCWSLNHRVLDVATVHEVPFGVPRPHLL